MQLALAIIDFIHLVIMIGHHSFHENVFYDGVRGRPGAFTKEIIILCSIIVTLKGVGGLRPWC